MSSKTITELIVQPDCGKKPGEKASAPSSVPCGGTLRAGVSDRVAASALLTTPTRCSAPADTACALLTTQALVGNDLCGVTQPW